MHLLISLIVLTGPISIVHAYGWNYRELFSDHKQICEEAFNCGGYLYHQRCCGPDAQVAEWLQYVCQTPTCNDLWPEQMQEPSTEAFCTYKCNENYQNECCQKFGTCYKIGCSDSIDQLRQKCSREKQCYSLDLYQECCSEEVPDDMCSKGLCDERSCAGLKCFAEEQAEYCCKAFGDCEKELCDEYCKWTYLGLGDKMNTVCFGKAYGCGFASERCLTPEDWITSQNQRFKKKYITSAANYYYGYAKTQVYFK